MKVYILEYDCYESDTKPPTFACDYQHNHKAERNVNIWTVTLLTSDNTNTTLEKAIKADENVLSFFKVDLNYYDNLG